MSGSGAVSRLARHLGMRVVANDWEYFAYVLSAAWLENDADELDALFSRSGGIRAALDDLNACGRAASSTADRTGNPSQQWYIARHFAPASTSEPQIGRERLFYTAENARFIDAVRERIDTLYPPGGSESARRARRLLISLLLYEASNHANTSGVFKAYHRGYGGLGRDSLSRILAPMELECPTLPDGPAGRAENTDAIRFAARHSGDICYLDPPYNSHQYGSNYFMLNTIARWDRPPVDDSLDERGQLKHKAGIRSDWRETRSPFCYRESAGRALGELLDRIDAGTILVSYSGSGVIEAEELADLLAARGSLRLHGAEYTAYRGGRQSLTRVKSGREMVFEVTTHRPPSHAAAAPSATASHATHDSGRSPSVARQLLEWRVAEVLGGRFVPSRLALQFRTTASGLQLAPGIEVPTDDYHCLGAGVSLEAVPEDELRAIESRLRAAACTDHEEEFRVLIGLMECHQSCRANQPYRKRLLTCLRKYAHRKYEAQFRRSVEKLEELIRAYPEELGNLSAGLAGIVGQASRRFGFE